ncbi:MAG: sugar ABC transporter ATP-binding protein [candidate division Zixibacteria bacterium]|nr:sugar ABC transporter ATP-binding protein [candidate division Zixibacteria bacterium]
MLLKIDSITKAFPGVQAIKSGSLELRAGEIHALVGENGAGKSTLIKILTGVHQPDAGSVQVDNRELQFTSPIDAHKAGIVAIYQEFSLVPSLTIAANLFLGREKTAAGLINSSLERARAVEALTKLGSPLDPNKRVGDLSVSEQQVVEIARALLANARILIMDEPTAALAPREVRQLFDILRDLVKSGIGIIFVSHRLDEVLEIADRVTVMRDGVTIETRGKADVTRRKLIELMVGRSLEEEFPRGKVSHGDVRLEVKHLTGGPVNDISFTVRAGEILGIAGLMGAGRTELARLIFGADSQQSGEIWLDGRRAEISSPRSAIRNGICLLTEDRKRQGLVLCLSAKDNFALSNLRRWARMGLMNHRLESSRFDAHVSSLAIKISSPYQRAESLSGGNQQKLLVARWLETDSRVIIFDEPTRGIDVGAKYEMYLLIRKLAAQGKAIVLISSELPEILGMSDRVLVMKQGEIAGEIIDVSSATQEQIMAVAV